jgi:hypothetical protein
MIWGIQEVHKFTRRNRAAIGSVHISIATLSLRLKYFGRVALFGGRRTHTPAGYHKRERTPLQRGQARDRSRAPGFSGAPVDVEAAADLAPDAVLDDKPDHQWIQPPETALDTRAPGAGIEHGIAGLCP